MKTRSFYVNKETYFFKPKLLGNFITEIDCLMFNDKISLTGLYQNVFLNSEISV